MQLSIIIPVLDEAEAIGPALDRLAAVRAAGAELIVIDGGSTDGTIAAARARGARVETAPRGRASQMNAGAARAGGDALLFLHADTRLPKDAAERIAHALVSHYWGRFDVRIEGRSPWLGVIASMMNLRSRLSGIATGDQAIFVRRAAFDAVGGFPAQPLMEDIELSRRLKRIGRPRCLRAKVVTSGRRWDRHGAWRTIVLMWSLRLRYFLGAPAGELARRYAKR